MIKWVKDLIRKEISDKYYTGPTGPIGPKGDKGEDGDSFTTELVEYMYRRHNHSLQLSDKDDVMEWFITYISNKVYDKVNEKMLKEGKTNKDSDTKESVDVSNGSLLDFYDTFCIELFRHDYENMRSYNRIVNSDSVNWFIMHIEGMINNTKIHTLYKTDSSIRLYFNHKIINFENIINLIKSNKIDEIYESTKHMYGDHNVSIYRIPLCSIYGAKRTYPIVIVEDECELSLKLNTLADMLMLFKSVNINNFGEGIITEIMDCVSGYDYISPLNDSDFIIPDDKTISLFKWFINNDHLSCIMDRHIENFTEKVKIVIEKLESAS